MTISSCKKVMFFLLCMVLVVPLPERLGRILGKFRGVLSKSQFENFQSVMFGLIVSDCKKTVTVMPILVQADIQTHLVKLTLAHTAINGQFWKIAAKVVSQVVEIKIRLLVHNFHIHSIFFSITFYLFENPN
jgi:hypothetical protein